MRFMITLATPFTREIEKELHDRGYKITVRAKGENEVLFVKNPKGKVEELENLPMVKRAKKEDGIIFS